MIKAVVFDMDGLMFDTERLTIKAWDYAGEKLGVGKMGYMVFKTLGMTIESSRKVFKQHFGDSFSEENLLKYTGQFFSDYYEQYGTPTKEGLYELLNYLKEKNYKIGVATSTRKPSALKHFERTNITSYFDAIVCGDMIEHGKPAPDIYLMASSFLNIEPSECIALEDSPNGITSAFRAGLNPIMIPDLIQPDDNINKMLFRKFTSLLEVIELLDNMKV